MKKDLSFLKENLIAHRGAHNINKGIPENSINAFKEAIKNNYIIELDIHLLKDNNIVVFHDDDLKRMTGVDKKLKDTTYEEIKDLKLQNTDNYIPLFKDVLDLINGKILETTNLNKKWHNFSISKELEKYCECKLKQKERTIVVYCQSGIRSKKAIKILNKNGFTNLFHLKGGLDGI